MGIKISEGVDGNQVLAESIYNFSYHSSGALSIWKHFRLDYLPKYFLKLTLTLYIQT